MTIGYFEMCPEGCFAIVDKDYFDANGHLNGDGLSESAEQALPDGFYELAACYYEYAGLHGDPSYELANAGFVKNVALVGT